MSIEKINSLNSIKQNISFKGTETVETKNVVDEEKSSSMSKMIGLGALATIAIGGAILYARKGRTPKVNSNTTTNSTTAVTSSTSSASGSPTFEPVKKFMKKLADGTEYLFRTEERDKDGNLLKSIRYSKDGKVERVREFKMAPAGVTDPARNVVASEIRYDKDGKIIYKRLENADFSGYEVEEFDDCIPAISVKTMYKEQYDGSRFRPQIISSFLTNCETGYKRQVLYGPKGEDDIVLLRIFDKKTGSKVVEEMEPISEDTYKKTIFGAGQSRCVYIKSNNSGPGKDEFLTFERYDSQGRLRELKDKVVGTLEVIDKKGRKTILSKTPSGEEQVAKEYSKNGGNFRQVYNKYEPNEGIFVDFYRDGKHIGNYGNLGEFEHRAMLTLEDGSSSTMFYGENGAKLRKLVIPSARDGARIESTYDEFGQIATKTTKNQVGTMTETYRKGKIVKREEVDADGTIAFRKFYDKKGDVSSLLVENNPDGSTEIVVHFSKTQETPEGLHYDFAPIKFDKTGNIVPHSYSNRGSMGNIDLIRKVLYELGEEDLLKKYYRPNGQTSLF